MYLIKPKSCKSVVNEIKLFSLALMMPLHKMTVGREIQLDESVSVLMLVGLCNCRCVRSTSVSGISETLIGEFPAHGLSRTNKRPLITEITSEFALFNN